MSAITNPKTDTWLRRFVGWLQRASSGTPSYGMIPPLGSNMSASGLLVSQATAMTVSAIYRAVVLRSQDVARCTPILFKETADGTRQKIAAADHAVARLFKRPNRVQTWLEYMRDTWASYLLRGNAYAAILRDQYGDPTELIWINPDAVMILEAVDGSWFYNVNRIGLFQMAMLQNFPIAIPAEDVLHFRGLSFNMLVGASTIGLARDVIGLEQGLSQQQSRWINNGARPSGVLETDHKLDEDTARRLKQQWEEFQAGVQNVGRTAVLEEGLKWKELQLTAVDLEFIKQRDLSIQDVARFFGVPTRKLYQPESARGNIIIQEDQAYINETVAPDLQLCEQKMVQAFDLDEDELGVFMDQAVLLRADPQTRYNLGRIGKLSGLITTNEWRRAENMPTMEGGDVLMQPVNLAPFGSDMSGTAPDDAGRPKTGQEPVSADTTSGIPDKAPEEY